MSKGCLLLYMKKFYNSTTTKETWSNINNILRRKDKKSRTLNIKHNDLLIDDINLPIYMNNSFKSIVSNLANNFPSEIDWSYFDNIVSNAQSFVFFPSSPMEVYGIIKNLANKGNALFDIKPKILNCINECKHGRLLSFIV